MAMVCLVRLHQIEAFGKRRKKECVHCSCMPLARQQQQQQQHREKISLCKHLFSQESREENKANNRRTAYTVEIKKHRHGDVAVARCPEAYIKYPKLLSCLYSSNTNTTTTDHTSLLLFIIYYYDETCEHRDPRLRERERETE